MDRDELVALLSPTGLDLLDELPPYSSQADVVKLVSALRTAGHSPELVAAVLTQAKLRAKAGGPHGKFGEFAARMLFTEAGLEQATRLAVAGHHAARFRSAGLSRVADLGCGIGGDALAMAALGLSVIAVERDEVTAAIAAYNLAPFENAVVEHGDTTEFDLARVDGVFFDPARRTAGHTDTRRLTNPSDYSPALDSVFATAMRTPTGVKLGPAFDRDAIPADAEAQWVSVDGSVVELGLWFGALARGGVKRAALVVTGSGAAELTGATDAPDEKVDALGGYVYEPDGAVIRARLIGDLARRIDAHPVSEGIGYLSGDTLAATPFATAFRVVEELPFAEKALGAALRARGIGPLEIKKRGVDVDPAVLRKRLKLHGTLPATIILTRVAGRHTALLVARV